MSTFFSAFGALTDSNISMVMLLVKATVILLVALGITLSNAARVGGSAPSRVARDRCGAAARSGAHCVGADPGENASTRAGVNARRGAFESGQNLEGRQGCFAPESGYVCTSCDGSSSSLGVSRGNDRFQRDDRPLDSACHLGLCSPRDCRLASAIRRSSSAGS